MTKSGTPTPMLDLDHQLYFPWGSFAVTAEGRHAFPEMEPLPDGPFKTEPWIPTGDLPHPPLDIVLVAPVEYEAHRQRQQVERVQDRWRMLVTAQTENNPDFERMFPGIRDPDADIVHSMCYGVASGLGQALLDMNEAQQQSTLRSRQNAVMLTGYGAAAGALVGDLIPDMQPNQFSVGVAVALVGLTEYWRRRQLNRDLESMRRRRPGMQELTEKTGAVIASMIHFSYHGPIPPEQSEAPYVTV